MGLLRAAGSDTNGPNSISDRDSGTASPQAPESVISLLSAPLSNVALSHGGLSGITLGDAGLRDVGVRGAVLSDVDIAAPLPDNPTRYDESTRTSQQPNERKARRRLWRVRLSNGCWENPKPPMPCRFLKHEARGKVACTRRVRRSMSPPGNRSMKTYANRRGMTRCSASKSSSGVGFRTTTSVRRPVRPRVRSGGYSLFEKGALECNGPYFRSVPGHNTFRDVFKPWLDRTL